MSRDYTAGDEPVPGFRLVRFLGAGAFGTVWEAKGPGGTGAALKVIRLEGREGRKEYRAISLVKTIRHPNLVPITAIWLKSRSGRLLTDDELSHADIRSTSSAELIDESGDPPAELLIAMGLGDKSLFDLLAEHGGRVPVEQLLGYIEDAAKGIDYLNRPVHDLGHGPMAVQHCDIKPQNIMLVGDAAQVCDFGLARALGGQDIKQTRSMACTPAYAAPEVFDGRGLGPATDQYSLAVSYYELRTGELPFAENLSPLQVMNVHLNGELDFSALPVRERQVLRKATSNRTEDRYASAVEFVKQLRRAVDPDLGPIGVPPPRVSTTSSTRIGSPHRATFHSGQEVGLGYRLTHKLHATQTDVIWQAENQAGKSVALVALDLTKLRLSVDFAALNLLQQSTLYHPYLSELEAIWLLDNDGQVLISDPAAAFESGQAVTMILAGKLAPKHLGQELEAAIAQGRGLAPDLLERVIRQLAEALDFLNTPRHRVGTATVGIQHQNIRPSTVMLFGETTRLGNFIRARIIHGPEQPVPSEYRHADNIGVAPEVRSGRLTLTSDQYSLAVLYWHLRLGVPFVNYELDDPALAEAQQRGVDVERLPEGERDVIRRATSQSPSMRFPSCKAMVEALYAVPRGTDLDSLPHHESPPIGFGPAVASQSTDISKSPRPKPSVAQTGTMVFQQTLMDMPLADPEPSSSTSMRETTSPRDTDAAEDSHVDVQPISGTMIVTDLHNQAYREKGQPPLADRPLQAPASETLPDDYVPPPGPKPWGTMLMTVVLLVGCVLGVWYLVDPSGVNQLIAEAQVALGLKPERIEDPEIDPIFDPNRVPNPDLVSNDPSKPPKNPPPDPRSPLQRAQEQLSAGDASAAIALFSEALTNDPRDVEALIGRGVARGRTERDWPAALADFEAARAASEPAIARTNALPEYAQALLKDGERHFEAGNLRDAAERFATVESISDRHRDAARAQSARLLGRARDDAEQLARDGEMAKAMERYQLLMDLDPEGTSQWKESSEYFATLISTIEDELAADRPTEALATANRTIEDALETGHRNWLRSGYLLKGTALQRLNQPAEAVAEFDRAAEAGNTSPILASRRGASLLEMGEVDRAMEDLNRAIDQDPTPIDLQNRAFAWMRRAEFGEALVDLNQAIELDPNDAQSYLSRAGLHSTLSRKEPAKQEEFREKALADVSQAIEIDPRNATAFLTRGIFQQSYFQRLGEAVDDYSEAIRLAEEADPQDIRTLIQALTRRAAVYELLKQPLRAEADRERVKQLENQST
jgi:serine/threonine protein kinase/tetratricopeptide (TPR) repeat protein